MRRTAPPERWHLVLEALPQRGGDAEVRLDHLLKAARRIYGIKCTERERELRPEATLQCSDAEAK